MELSLIATIGIALIAASATSLAAPVPERMSRRAQGSGNGGSVPFGNLGGAASHSSTPALTNTEAKAAKKEADEEAERARKAKVDQPNIDLLQQANDETKAENKKSFGLGVAILGGGALAMAGIQAYNAHINTNPPWPSPPSSS
ncbi:hypothetical protein K437DRAFT_273800 [Tilletiaria anomala UBC 951]|uniref:Uncharacterized protein n=1 Tax=Tilletiaria anomala (strain ATCC 24038 / CBS 436.72 / UBC 951) TaxID=1037660 RepID=A0A066W388_TILAU|nr:uncharacterized protein K437DRAFT_273800 [Tilletiaria anomala UBC 951]KDN47013.1 hypothetical protein K437DRAFT_273800 [Tilletiaria anomala UBC 951]